MKKIKKNKQNSIGFTEFKNMQPNSKVLSKTVRVEASEFRAETVQETSMKNEDDNDEKIILFKRKTKKPERKDYEVNFAVNLE